MSIGLVLGPLADARAQTPLADIPIASKVTAKPNIVYTLDDSGSMQFNYLPDWVIAGAAVANVTSITRVGAVATVTVASTAALSVGQWVIILGANQPEYNGEFKVQSILSGTKFTISVVGAPATPATGTIKYSIGSAYCRSGTTVAPCSVGALSTFNSPPFYAASFNHLAYDTNVNYQPPVKYDRTPLTHTIGSDTDGLGNQAFFNNVQTDPFTAPNTHANLTVKVAVPLYCNTDWPITSGGAASSLTIADVGDPNGEYQAGTGAWCRINGTKYDASIASGAPAVLEDYNYPYQSSSGATGTQYFYRQLTNKILYCDRSSPYWPKTTGAIIGCTLGGTPTCGGLPCAPQKQTCNLSTPGKTCNPTVALRNFTPAACKTPNALYCLPSVGGSDSFSPGTGTAPECLSCTCNADYQPPNTKKCSITGAACTTVCGVPGCNVAECPDQPAPAPNGCSAGVPIYSYVPVGSPACTAYAVGSGGQCPPVDDDDAAAGLERAGLRLPPQQPGLRGQRCARGGRAVHVPADQHRRRLRRQQDGHRAVHAARPLRHRRTGVFHRQRLPDDRHDDQHPAPLLHDRLASSSATTSTRRSTGSGEASAPACASRRTT